MNSNRRLFNLILILLGNCLYALAVKMFLLPAGLISSGTTGIALTVNHLTGLPISAFIFVFNVTMLALGWLVLGRQFALTTIFSSLFYPIALEALNRLLGEVSVTDQTLLNALFAGLGLGLALGMVIRGGASTGGMDIPPLILNRKFRIPVSVSLWVFDFCIMLSQALYHRGEDLLYGVILLIVTSVALNKVLLLGTNKIEIKVVSPDAAQIREAILSQADRGVTVLYGEGGYLKQPTQVLLCVVSNHELPRVEALIRRIDPDCFMIVSQVTEVWGRGFSMGKRYESK